MSAANLGSGHDVISVTVDYLKKIKALSKEQKQLLKNEEQWAVANKAKLEEALDAAAEVSGMAPGLDAGDEVDEMEFMMFMMNTQSEIEALSRKYSYESLNIIMFAFTALLSRGSISTKGKFRQEHYDLLVQGCSKVLGKIHPDDK